MQLRFSVHLALLAFVVATSSAGEFQVSDPTTAGFDAEKLVSADCLANAGTIELQAKDTLTAIEMDHGDELRFRLRDGRLFTLILEDTNAAIVENVKPGGIIYRFAARVRVDGQPMTMERYVCCQECFYEPYVINGVRIWLDTVKDVFDLIPIRYPRKGNLQCFPRKSARLAIQDATLRICPEELYPWIEDDENFINVGMCYNGDDSYLGPYLGQACHVGMDINQAKGSVLSAPIDFDTHAYFNSLAMGHNNNRWRGIRRWENGDVWALQTHHLIELLVPEDSPLESRVKYATTAGVHVGSHEHTHFEFKTGRPRDQKGADRDADEPTSIAALIDFDDDSTLAQERPEVLHLDPWIICWQIFEDRKARRGQTQAAMKPLGPAHTGQSVTFSAKGSQAGSGRSPLRHFWTFGDGGTASEPTSSHVFARQGIYPVTLVIDDGTHRASTTQHITVSGDPIQAPVLALTVADESSFRIRPVQALDVYGWPAPLLPHTLQFIARASRPLPHAKIIRLENMGTGELVLSSPARIQHENGVGWLKVARHGQGNRQTLDVAVDAAGLAPGKYSCSVEVSCQGALNSPQRFRVELQVASELPKRDVTVDDRDPGFYATPYFWVGHRFCNCPADKRGYNGFYLTNGGRPVAGEFARFRPYLQDGQYEVSLSDQTPFQPEVEFDVRVRDTRGELRVRVQPDKSRVIGRFKFEEGTDGFVEILAENSKGLVIADAVNFRRK